jgi:hypothetical protein
VVADLPDLRRPRLALPFTVLASANTVRLVAGEDFRYTLTGEGLDRWLPPLLERLDGRRTVGEAVAALSAEERLAAARIVDRLYFGDRGLAGVRDRCETVVADMRRIGPEELADVDSVINIGGLSNDPTAEYNPRANYEMNTVAAHRLAELAKAAGVTRTESSNWGLAARHSSMSSNQAILPL